MPLLVKSLQTNYLSSKEKKDLCQPDNNGCDYNFKYVPANFFNQVVKNVRRQRCKEDEELIWASFVNQQDLNNINPHMQDHATPIERTQGISHQSINKINKQAEILERDIFSDKSKKVCNSSDGIDNSQDLSKKNRTKNIVSVRKSVIKDNGTNCIGAMPRTHKKGNISNQNKSLENRSYKMHMKDSLSDKVMSKKKTVHSRHFCYTIEKCENNSNPELNTNNDKHNECKDESIFIRIDAGVAQKIIAKQKKISCLLDEISFRLQKIPLPDGERDAKRRQQRVMEFAIRFSRNYLYELHRDITTIQQHIHAVLLCTKIKASQRSVTFYVHAIEQKLISVHHLLLHALVAYCKHIPSSTIKEEPSKLKELLQVVIDLKDICNKIYLEAVCFGSGDDGRSLETDIHNKCNIILSKLSLNSDRESQVICRNTHKLCSSVPMLPHGKTCSAHKNVCNRLQMYNSDTKTTKTHKMKLCIHPPKGSRYDSNTGKTLLVSCPSTPDRTHPTPATQVTPKESTNSKIMQYFPSLRDDDINTMMDFVSVNADNKSETNENIDVKVTPKTDCTKCYTFQNSSIEHAYESATSKTASLENVKLVYMSSAENTLNNIPHHHDVSCQADCESVTRSFPSEKTIHEKKDANDHLSVKKPVQIMVSKAVKFRFLNWKAEYQRFLQENPMYSTNTQNKPWDIVTWISDKLVEELIIEIAKELELNDLIQKLFKLEFEEY